MPSTQTNGTPRLAFTPVEFDASKLDPEAPTGKWTASCKVKTHVSQEHKKPMLIVEWKLEGTEESDHETFLGKKVTDFVGFPATGSKGANFAKIHLRQLCEAIEFPLENVPSGTLSSWDDLDPLVEALDGREITIWTTTKEEESGESRTRVSYVEPRGFAAAMSSDDDEEEEAAPPPKKAAAAKGKPAPAAAKKTARR
jgi:hypothetical protein